MTATDSRSDTTQNSHENERIAPFEWECLLLLVMAALLYLPQLTTLELRGEESRRGVVAQQMIRTGDYIVPRIHGDARFMSARPPLQMWLIAVSSQLSGEVDIFAVRFPSIIALFSLTLLLYFYARLYLSRFGAFCCAAAYISMAQVLELGRTGETDLVFSLFVASSLLSWHAGYLKKWNPALVWSLGYGFCALATMTKGPQGPVYFAAPVFGYLLLSGSWRYLFRPGHFVGLAVFSGLWGPWNVLYALSEGWEGLNYIYMGDVNRYGHEQSLLEHLFRYPVETLVCLFPWVCVFPALTRTQFRQQLRSAGLWPQMMFLTCCVVLTYPSVWFVAGAQSRFYMSIYPCIAIMCGIVMELFLQSADGSRAWWDWARYLCSFGIAMPIVGTVFVFLAYSGTDWTIAQQPGWFAILFCLMCFGGSYLNLRARNDRQPIVQKAAVCVIALFAGLIVNGIRLNAEIAKDVNRARQVEAVAARIPEGETLYYLGAYIHPLSFYYNQPLESITVEEFSDLPDHVRYFCVNTRDPELIKQLPFGWEPLGAVTQERGLHDLWRAYLIIGKRSPDREPQLTAQMLEPILEEFEALAADSEPVIRIGESKSVERY